MIYIIIFIINIAFCSDFYKGRVVDESGNPLYGVNINLIGSGIGVSTDNDGYFIIDKNVRYSEAEISYIGYTTKIIDFLLEDDNDIVLSVSPLNVDEIVVTGTRRKSYIKNIPVTTRVISYDDIEKSGVASVKDLLELAIPNVQNVMSSHAGISNDNVKIQGLDNRYMLFLVDGARISGEFAGNLDFSMLNLSNVQSVEVIEGGMSSLYGSSAIGGVVNIITKKNQNPFKFEYSYFYDDPVVISEYLNIGFTFKNINYKLNLSKQNSEGYDLTPHPQNYTYPLKTQEEYESMTIGHNFEYYINDYLTLDLNYKNYRNDIKQYQNHFVMVTDDNNELYPFYYYSSYRSNMPFFEDDEYIVKLNYQNESNSLLLRYHQDNYMKGNYFYNFTNLDCDSNDINYFCNSSSDLVGEEFINADNINKNFLFQYDLKYNENNFFTIGYEKNDNKYGSYNIYSYTGDNNNDGLCGSGTPWDPDDCLVESIFGAVDDTKEYSKEAFFIGNQYEINKRNVISFSARDISSKNFGDDLIYSAAYMLKNKFYNYRLNFSKGFRIPSIKELYYDFQSHPPPILGNPDLKSTTNSYISASLEKRTFDRNSSFELYYNDVKDMIGINYADIDGDGQDDILIYNNFSQVNIKGFNFHYEYFSNKNGIKFVYNYTDPSSDDVGALELISKNSVRLRYTRKISDKLEILINSKYSGKKFIMYGDDRMYLDDYSITDLIMSFDINQSLSLNFGCKNLFDYMDDRRFLEDDYLRDILTTYNPGKRYFAEFKVLFTK